MPIRPLQVLKIDLHIILYVPLKKYGQLDMTDSNRSTNYQKMNLLSHIQIIQIQKSYKYSPNKYLLMRTVKRGALLFMVSVKLTAT